MDCSKITAGLVAAECDGVSNGGTTYKAWIFNYADIDRDSTTINADNTTITVLALKQNAKGYTYESFDNSTDGSATLNKGTYVSTYDHQVTLRVFSDTEDARKFINNAKEARIIVVLGKKDKNGTIFEAYGYESGMKMSENPYNTKYTDNVVFAPVFKSDDDSKENALPYIVDMSEAALDALCQ